MLPDLSILLALIVGLLHLQAAPVSPLTALAGTAAAVLVAVALTWMNADRGVKAIQRGDTSLKELRWPTQWAVLAWLAILIFFHWGSLVGSTVPRTEAAPCTSTFRMQTPPRSRIASTFAFGVP